MAKVETTTTATAAESERTEPQRGPRFDPECDHSSPCICYYPEHALSQAPTIDLDAIIARVTETLMLTACCWGYDTYWGDLHVCRRCEASNPVMVDVPRVDAEARWATQEGV